MSASEPTPAGPGEIAFAVWATPFTDAAVDILGVACAQSPGDDGLGLTARVRDLGTGHVYRVVFPTIAAMRLLDEGGLLEVWQRTAEIGGRPGRTTFRLRNHGWTRESPLTFLASDGWSFVIASDDLCLEVVSATTPAIAEE
jgi:hypothetical protein